jgi:hypothetical protein
VLQELRSVGVPCNGDPTAAAAALSLDLLKQLPYCTAVLQEAMRMFPAGVMAASRCAGGGGTVVEEVGGFEKRRRVLRGGCCSCCAGVRSTTA